MTCIVNMLINYNVFLINGLNFLTRINFSDSMVTDKQQNDCSLWSII